MYSSSPPHRYIITSARCKLYLNLHEKCILILFDIFHKHIHHPLSCNKCPCLSKKNKTTTQESEKSECPKNYLEFCTSKNRSVMNCMQQVDENAFNLKRLPRDNTASFLKRIPVVQNRSFVLSFLKASK